MLKKFMTSIISSIFGISCLLAVPAAIAQNNQVHTSPSAAEMTADLLLVRPLMLAATAIGSTVFIVSLPFSLLGGNADDARQELVVKPVNATFLRCLGCY